jgi:hypothetical protein
VSTLRTGRVKEPDGCPTFVQAYVGRKRRAKPTIASCSFSQEFLDSDNKSIRNIPFSAHVRRGERGAPVWLQYPSGSIAMPTVVSG